MLASRIRTALLLIPIVLLTIFFLPSFWFVLMLLGVTLLAAWEYADLVKINSGFLKIVFLMILLAVSILILNFFPAKYLLWSNVVFWLLAAGCIFYPEKFYRYWLRYPLSRWIVGIFLLASAWLAIVILQAHPLQLLILLLTIWLADSSAYFIGKKWGKHKLAEKVSPGKTLEGTSAIGVTMLIWGAFLAFIHAGGNNVFNVILLILVTGMAAIVGDLFESLIKRAHGVKDSGNILPGHGGLLDRIDSLLAAAPIYLILSGLWQIRF